MPALASDVSRPLPRAAPLAADRVRIAAAAAPVFEDDDADILEDPLVRRHAAARLHVALRRCCALAPRVATLTAAPRHDSQGMGWLNQSSLTLSKQRPVGQLRKRRGIFIGA